MQSLAFRLDRACRMMLVSLEKVQDIASRKIPGGDPGAKQAKQDLDDWRQTVAALAEVLGRPQGAKTD